MLAKPLLAIIGAGLLALLTALCVIVAAIQFLL